MIYPRLKLARNLLSEDGVLLVSINDVEAGNLKKLAARSVWRSELYRSVRVAQRWQRRPAKQSKRRTRIYTRLCSDHRELPAPNRDRSEHQRSQQLYRKTIENSITKNGPANPPSVVTLPVGFPAGFSNGRVRPRVDKFPHILDEILVRDGLLVQPARLRSGWSSRQLLDQFINCGCTPIQDTAGRETWFELRDSGAIYGLKKRADDQGHVLSVLRNMGTTKQNSSMLRAWGLKFSYPKPVFLIEYLIRVFTRPKRR